MYEAVCVKLYEVDWCIRFEVGEHVTILETKKDATRIKGTDFCVWIHNKEFKKFFEKVGR